MITRTKSATIPLHDSTDAELAFQKLKTSIHEELVESLDLTVAGQIENSQMRREVGEITQEIIQSRRLSLDDNIRERLLDEVQDEVFGLGPIEPLMNDPTISDILVNGWDEVYIERHGRLEETGIIFADDDHVLRIVQRVVARVSRRIDEVSPMVDARLADGSRINAVIPPISLGGPKLSIRRFGAERMTMDDLIHTNSLTPEIAEFLKAAVAARVSCLVSGGTGAGKTTLLNALTESIPEDERIITIEDSAELALMHRHVVRMETRPINTEGAGDVSQRDLVRNSLRMRPDRILVGEVRGSEALDMLQAMNTGHEGSLTTIHANDTLDSLARLEMMVAMTGFELPVNVVRQYIAAGIKLVVHLARLKGGTRKVMRVSEIVEVRDGRYELQEIFGFRQQGLDALKVAKGTFYATGYRPKCAERFEDEGVELNDAVFKTTDCNTAS